MKISASLFFVVFSFGSLGAFIGETALSAPATKEMSTTKKKKSTEMSFDDVLVQGKYHFSDEVVTTVEEDKVLDGLLGIRKDFKDRMKKSAARH